MDAKQHKQWCEDLKELCKLRAENEKQKTIIGQVKILPIRSTFYKLIQGSGGSLSGSRSLRENPPSKE